jgi:hypothetical protein
VGAETTGSRMIGVMVMWVFHSTSFPRLAGHSLDSSPISAVPSGPRLGLGRDQGDGRRHPARGALVARVRGAPAPVRGLVAPATASLQILLPDRLVDP